VRRNVVELPAEDAELRMLLERVQAEERDSARAILAGRLSPVSILALADDSQARFDREAGKLPPPRRLACKAGCYWCCHGPVQTSAVEALRIAAYLRAADRGGRVAEVRRLTSAWLARAAANPSAAARLPCPLLANGRCSIYAARPLACRAWNSYDANACREDLLGVGGRPVPVHRLHLALEAVIAAGLDEALVERGLRADVLELAPALSAALSSRSAERWLAGEPVFGGASSVER
jgi:Fe-S-cluster containining protein